MSKQDIPVLDRIRTEMVRAVSRSVTPPERARWRRLLTAIAATGVVAAAVVAVVVFMIPGRESTHRAGPLGRPQHTLGSAASCVETYSLSNLAARDFAFDGTVTAIDAPPLEGNDPTLVTFSVNHWYKGGSGDQVQLKTYDRPDTISSVSIGEESGAHLTVGQRILASGDDDFLWDCGFSMLYSAHNEAIFSAAFER
jgi:hypothetical protein